MIQLRALGLILTDLNPLRRRGCVCLLRSEKRLHFLLCCVLAVCGLGQPSHAQSMQSQSSDEAQAIVGYDQVREVIRKRCVTCHNPDEMRGDLDLSSLTALRAGASSGPIVVAGKPNQSMLYKSAAHLDDPVMPPNSPKIPGRELDLLRRWIEGGLAEKTGMQSEVSADAPIETASATSGTTAGSSASKETNVLVPVRAMMHSTAIAALDAHPKQDVVAISGNQQAVLLDITTGKWLGAFDFPEGDVTALRFSRDGRLLLVAGGVAGLSGRVVAIDVATGNRVFELADEKDTILSVDLSPDGSMVALGGPAKVVRIYSAASGEVLHTLRKHTDWVLTVRFSPDGLLLASGDRFGGLFVWEPQRGAEFHTLRGHAGPINAVVWDQSAETLVSGGEDGRIRTWNLHHGELTSQWDAGVGAILSLDTNGTLVACGGRNNSTVVWNGPEQKLAAHHGNDQIERVAIAVDGNSLVSADATGNIKVLELQSAMERISLSLPVDETELQVVRKRMETAEADYAMKLRERASAAPTELASDVEQPANSTAKTTMTATVLALKSEIDSARQHTALLRQNRAAITESLGTVAKVLKQLEQSHVELQSQLEKQDTLLAASEKQTLALEAAFAKLLASNQQLSSDVSQQQKQSLTAKLEQQKKLLATSLQMLDQLNVPVDTGRIDDDLNKTQQIALELANELRNRVEHTTAQLETADDKPVTRASLVDAEK